MTAPTVAVLDYSRFDKLSDSDDEDDAQKSCNGITTHYARNLLGHPLLKGITDDMKDSDGEQRKLDDDTVPALLEWISVQQNGASRDNRPNAARIVALYESATFRARPVQVEVLVSMVWAARLRLEGRHKDMDGRYLPAHPSDGQTKLVMEMHAPAIRTRGSPRCVRGRAECSIAMCPRRRLMSALNTLVACKATRGGARALFGTLCRDDECELTKKYLAGSFGEARLGKHAFAEFARPTDWLEGYGTFEWFAACWPAPVQRALHATANQCSRRAPPNFRLLATLWIIFGCPRF